MIHTLQNKTIAPNTKPPTIKILEYFSSSEVCSKLFLYFETFSIEMSEHWGVTSFGQCQNFYSFYVFPYKCSLYFAKHNKEGVIVAKATELQFLSNL